MKLGKFDGSKEEIQNLLIDNGFNISDYIGKPFKVMNNKWLIIPSIMFVLFLILIIYIGNPNDKLCKIMFLMTFGSGIWLASCVQIRFKNGSVTIIVIIGLVLILLLASGYILPKEIIDIIKKFKE